MQIYNIMQACDIEINRLNIYARLKERCYRSDNYIDTHEIYGDLSMWKYDKFDRKMG